MSVMQFDLVISHSFVVSSTSFFFLPLLPFLFLEFLDLLPPFDQNYRCLCVSALKDS